MKLSSIKKYFFPEATFFWLLNALAATHNNITVSYEN